MTPRRLALLPTLLFAAATAMGCARDISPSVYHSGGAGQTVAVETGTVVSVRPVLVRGTDSLGDAREGRLIGGVIGAAGGAAIGHEIGQGYGNTLATIGGGIIGGLAGQAVGAATERELTTQRGYEYVVRLASGRTVAIVQGGAPIAAGTPVRLHGAAGGRGRIVPA